MEFLNNPQILLDRCALVQRFVDYARMDTKSDEDAKTFPSTPGQRLLAERAAQDLRNAGVRDVKVDSNGYLVASIPSNVSSSLTVALIAHMDTSPAAPGANVHPVLHKNYDGNDIVLKDGVVIEADEILKQFRGDTVITSDGTTLLGADDKAGMAVIVSAAEYWMKNPDVPHPAIRICFTPDEEVGRGTEKFPYMDVGADFAYTLDGSFVGEINIETFEAYSATIRFEGVSTHPGRAEGKLVNALKYMADVICLLPRECAPETTRDRQGFIHPVSVDGDSSECTLHLILRDFEKDKALALKSLLESIVADVAAKDARLRTRVTVKHTYPNMHPYFKDREDIWRKLEEAVRLAGITPVLVPIRGGTDGALLTKNGLLCPNIFAGGMNFHDKREWVSDRAMGLSLCTVLNLMVLLAT
jgi:tripeptide aminopeptidase